MQKTHLILFAIIGLSVSFTACSKQESSPNNLTQPTPTAPSDTITSFMVFFTNTTDSSAEVGSYDDPDGPGPKPANIGGVNLKANSDYIITLRIEDASNPSKPVYIHNKIKTSPKDYKICLSNPLGIIANPTDTDGSYPIGLVHNLRTSSSTGYETMSFTIKYQKNVKNGQCDPGVVYYTCDIPVGVQ